ncbi:MAG TPA: ADP-ribose pyrophosphatase [Actinobacteria bacterium]|nr:ADP-ribose pyrophosphatase [Actinomycetota bacterium]HCK78731.1 ADP-ribose pyrophosphatase [Actinomycetota bacterium]
MRQSVDLGAAGTVVRDVVRHPGAAAVIALDERDRVVLVNQYRHPVGARLWEAPAGLVDREDEDPLQTAQRELAEEAGLRADLWFPLLTMALTPGGSDERIHLFLARGLSVADTEEFVPTGEESTMHSALVPLDDLVSAVLEGRIANATLVAGVLAVQRHRDEQWRGLPEPA